MTVVLVAGSMLATSYMALLVLWAIMGVGYSLTLTRPVAPSNAGEVLGIAHSIKMMPISAWPRSRVL